MSAADQTCDVCKGESGGEYVGVAAIPGVPMSVAWCRSCLMNNAVPQPIAEFWFFDIAGGYLSALAPWTRTTSVWKGGEYLPFDSWTRSLTSEQVAEALREIAGRDVMEVE